MKRNPRSVQDVVYSTLRSSIINLNLAPGTVISETEISLKFQVSRTPVRETFIHLSKEGLVEVIPQKETLVSLIDPARVEQEFFIRESLETAVLELFLRSNGSQYFAELENLINQQAAALKSKSYTDFINYDDRFHEIFFEGSGQHLSWEVISSMSGHYHRIRMLTILMAGIANGKVEEHRKILAALKKGNAAIARKMLFQHLHNLDSEKLLLEEKFPGYFVSKKAQNKFDVDFGGLPLIRPSQKNGGEAPPASVSAKKKKPKK